jgi:hypothetical protein
MLLGLKYDQGPLAFVSKLLLLQNIFKARLLRTLELRIVYCRTQIHTTSIKTVPFGVNRYNK